MTIFVIFSILSQEEEALSSLQEHNLIFLGRAEAAEKCNLIPGRYEGFKNTSDPVQTEFSANAPVF